MQETSEDTIETVQANLEARYQHVDARRDHRGDERRTRTAALARGTITFHGNPDRLKPGHELAAIVDLVGNVAMVVTHAEAGSFTARFKDRPPAKLGRIVDSLAHDREGRTGNAREHERIQPLRKVTTLTRTEKDRKGRESEKTSFSTIRDLSRSGVAFTSAAVLTVGEAVRVGARGANVVRAIEGGYAAMFHEPIGACDFSHEITL